MNEITLKKLELNLTKSARKAKKFWVRGMVGLTESDQGFFSIESIPVDNPIKGKPTPLAELIEDCGILSVKHSELKEKYEQSLKDLQAYKDEQEEIQKENKKNMDELSARLTAIESFRID